MKSFFHKLKKHWITVWLIAVIVLALSFFVFAEYLEESNRAKRVIANTTGAGELFTSDHLSVGGSEHLVPFGETTENYYDLPIRIWNYDSANPTMFYDKDDITYTLVAQLMKKDENDNYVVFTADDPLADYTMSIKKDPNDLDYISFTSTPDPDRTITVGTGERAYTYTIHQDYSSTDGFRVTYSGLKLLKESRDENKYYVRFPKSMASASDKIYVKLTAIPTPSPASYEGVNAIEGIVSVTEGKTELSQGWSCSFNDSEKDSDYDGFNYVISGNGTATITLRWRDDKFEINPFFLDDNGITPTQETISEKTWNVIVINANSEIKNRYSIQFYMKDGKNDTYGWDDVKTYVTYEIR